MNNHTLLSVAVVLFFVMFVYSGINKIQNFDKKVDTLEKKIGVSDNLAKLGMALVILLEIVGSLYLVLYFTYLMDKKNEVYKKAAIATLVLFLLFMVVVTLLYHPPTKQKIPFLSNVTTFAGFLLMLGVALQ